MIPAGFKLVCPYCGGQAEWVDNSVVYGKTVGRFTKIWWCAKDRAYVGCHNNTMRPLGTMANAQLREWRRRTHREIDVLWTMKKMTRDQMYRRLSEMLGHEVHVAWADVDECERIMEAAKKL